TSVMFMSVFGGLETERNPVVAVTQAGRSRAIGEQMPLMGTTVGTVVLHPAHPVTVVFTGSELAGDRVEEAGPAGAALELRASVEQRFATCCAAEHARP